MKSMVLRCRRLLTRRRGRRGYNLVVLTVSFTLLSIWVASVTPLWSHQIKRDKEAELIFRGLQYAEAIRIFQLRQGRPPVRLKELIEVEPRSIRQLWTNPMTEDGRWGLIPVGVGGGQPVQPATDTGLSSGGGEGSDDDNPFGGGRDSEDGAQPGVILSEDFSDDSFGRTERPASFGIRGVFNPSSEEAILTFLGKSSHREWQFTADIFATMKQGTPDNPALVTPFLANEIGKPWPPGVVPQVPQPSDKPPRAGGPNGGAAQDLRNSTGATLGGNRPSTQGAGQGGGGAGAPTGSPGRGN